MSLGSCSSYGSKVESGPSNRLEDAVAAYVTAGNLDRRAFQLTNPADCNAVQDATAARGRICIDFKDSRIAAKTAELEVGVYGTEGVWKLDLRVSDGKWVVSGSRYAGN